MSPANLTPTQLDRYSRHVIMDNIEADGQAALLDSSVLVVGAGGLGSPVIQYLAAAGIGTIGIVDDDDVERSNLQRQIIHGEDDVGRSKVESAAEFIDSLNPDITVETHRRRLDASIVGELIDPYDVVVDASDNFPTRYLINDACTLTETPFSHGAVFQFEGQVTTFDGTGPCYRCLFPEAPPEETVPDCATAGVLGVLPGTIGCLQATEVLKLILGHGETLEGRHLTYDATSLSFDELEFERNPGCPICTDEPTVDTVEAIEYRGDCAIGNGR
jgi:adenylyltransferase/sulfurtransferase